jgi:hypothetical protein
MPEQSSLSDGQQDGSAAIVLNSTQEITTVRQQNGLYDVLLKQASGTAVAWKLDFH